MNRLPALRRFFLFPVLIFAAFGLASDARAASRTWDGGTSGTNSAWNSNNNWNSNGSVGSGDTASFTASGANSKWIINVSSGAAAQSLTFNSSSGSQGFTFRNNSLSVGTGGIANNDGDTQTFESSVSLAGAQTWAATSGALSFAAVDMNQHLLTLSGNSAIQINGAATDVGSITKGGNGAFVMNGTVAVQTTATWTVNAGSMTLNGATDLNQNALTVAGANNLSFAAAVSDVGDITKNGAGALAFNSTVTLGGSGQTRTWTVNSGSFTVNNTLSLGTGTGANRNTLIVDGSGDLTIAATISGTGNITKNGSGTLYFSGGSAANTYTGTTQVNAGELVLGKDTGTDAINNGSVNDLVIGNGSSPSATVTLAASNQIDNSALVTINSDGVLALGSFSETVGNLYMNDGSVTGSGTLTLGGTIDVTGSSSISSLVSLGSATKTFDIDSGGSLTISGNSSNVRGITKNGTGTLTFDGTVSLSGSAAWTVNDGSIDVNNTLSLGSNTLTISGDSNVTLDGAVTGSGGITMNSSGVLVLSSTSSTYSGVTQINSGTVQISSNDNLGNDGGDVSFGGGALAVTGSGTVTATSGRQFQFDDGSGTFDIASGVTFAINSDNRLTGASQLVKTGDGRLILGGNNSSGFTGGAAINGGTIQISAENSLGAAGNDIYFNGGTLNVTSGFTANSGKVFTFNGGGGTLDIDSSQTLTLGTDGQLSGSGNLTKSGSGTLALSGNNSSSFNSGNTISINGGTVEISNENNLGGGGNDLAFNGGTLKVSSGFTANSGKTLTFNGSGGTLDVTSGTLSFNSGNQLYGSGDLTKSGAGNLIISADNPSYSGNLKLNSGELQVAGTGAQLSSFLNNTRMANLSGTGPATFMVNQTDSGTATLGTGPVLPSQIKLGFEGSGTFALGTTANDMSNFEGLIIEGGTVSVRANQRFTGDAAGGGTSAGTSLYISGGELELFHADSKTLEFTGNITLAGGVIDGGLSGGAKGKLRTESDLIVNSVTTLQSKPDLEFLDNATDAHTISLNGASSTGWGTITLAGQNQLTVNATGGAEVGANRIDVSTGTLLWGADNVITGTTEIKLGYGGTLKTMGYDDTVGPLTLDSTIGYIDLAGGDSTLEFADTGGQLWSGGGQLVIKNWDGLVDGKGNDKVIFGDVAFTGDGLTDEQLAQIWFENPAGFPPGMYPAEFVPNRSGYSHYGQIRPRPVPEPATVAMVVLLIGVIAYRERKSLLRWKTSLLAAVK